MLILQQDWGFPLQNSVRIGTGQHTRTKRRHREQETEKSPGPGVRPAVPRAGQPVRGHGQRTAEVRKGEGHVLRGPKGAGL